MSCLIIPNTTSWDSYLSIVKHLKKNKINFKVLIINKSVHDLVKKTGWLKDYLIKIEPNYKQIFDETIIIKIFKLLFYHFKYYLFGYSLFKKYKFKNIILAGDRDTPLMLILIKFAKKINSKVYIFHNGIFASPKMIGISRKIHKFYLIKKKTITYNFFKKYCIDDSGDKKIAILYYDKIQIYLHKIFDILPNSPWIPAGGRSDAYLVENDIVKNLYKKKGCEKKIIVVGSKDQNNIIKFSKKIIKKKNIQVALILTQWFEHNLMGLDAHRKRNEILCKSISYFNSKFKMDINLFLHPKQKSKDYKWVKKYNINISKKKFSEGLPDIDLIFIGFSSSIISWSVKYNIQTIIADIFREKHPIFYGKNIIYAKNLSRVHHEIHKNLIKLKNNKRIKKKITNIVNYENKIKNLILLN